MSGMCTTFTFPLQSEGEMMAPHLFLPRPAKSGWALCRGVGGRCQSDLPLRCLPTHSSDSAEEAEGEGDQPEPASATTRTRGSRVAAWSLPVMEMMAMEMTEMMAKVDGSTEAAASPLSAFESESSETVHFLLFGLLLSSSPQCSSWSFDYGKFCCCCCSM